MKIFDKALVDVQNLKYEDTELIEAAIILGKNLLEKLAALEEDGIIVNRSGAYRLQRLYWQQDYPKLKGNHVLVMKKKFKEANGYV